MHADDTAWRYGIVTQTLHWLTAIAVLAAYFLGPGGREQRAFSPAMDWTRQLHETVGLALFGIVLLRIVWRIFEGEKAHAGLAKWMVYSSKFVHLLLYALLIGIPATAITGTWLEGHPLTLLGGTTLAPLVTEIHDLGTSIMEIHTTLGNVILWVAGLHAAAALGHHFLLRDRVLVSMVPGRTGY
jgi:cytochrome b561